MNKLFRLKENAVEFFDKNIRTRVEPLDFWERNHVSKNAVESVENVYLTYGIKYNQCSTSLSGWDSDKRSHFDFTINFINMEHETYKLLADKGKIVNLMREIQKTANSFLSNELKQSTHD